MIKKISKKQILSEVQIPEDTNAFLSGKERALLKYILAEMNISELRKVYRCKTSKLQLEIIMDILSLGHRLAAISILENILLINWSKTNNAGYLEGFLDCKNQIKKGIKDGIRHK